MDHPLDDLYDSACDACGRKIEILEVHYDFAATRCDCGEFDVDFDDGTDEAAVYY